MTDHDRDDDDRTSQLIESLLNRHCYIRDYIIRDFLLSIILLQVSSYLQVKHVQVEN